MRNSLRTANEFPISKRRTVRAFANRSRLRERVSQRLLIENERFARKTNRSRVANPRNTPTPAHHGCSRRPAAFLKRLSTHFLELSSGRATTVRTRIYCRKMFRMGRRTASARLRTERIAERFAAVFSRTVREHANCSPSFREPFAKHATVRHRGA